ncbi:hypothetical protein PR003_g28022, partial [Phytophthora rubi]
MTRQESLGDHIRMSEASLVSTLTLRARMLQLHRDKGAAQISKALLSIGIQPPDVYPTSHIVEGKVVHLIDRNKQAAFSEFLRRSRMKLPDFVRLVRGETTSDPRPNKALEIPDHLPGWSSYPHRARWEAIVRTGVIPTWTTQFPSQQHPPPNHGSLQEALDCVVKNLRQGQDKGQYLVLDIGLLTDLTNVTCSPFGAAQKGNAPLSESARTIHDLSFPEGSSVNDLTADSLAIDVSYDGAAALANRILEVQAQFPQLVKMLSGDVAGAFRNIPIHADHVGRFSGVIRELGILVIDLSCPFGWSDSPRQYWIAGNAIKHIYGVSAPTWPRQPRCASRNFDSKAWCDDHNCIEPDVGSRLADANVALRRTMAAVLGPEAINEDKFTGWFHRGRALGLIWDLPSATLSMPKEKIAKAEVRIDLMASQGYTTRSQLRKLLGSLRHVVTCVRPAMPFFQSLADLARIPSRSWRIRVSKSALDDLRWFKIILSIGQFNSVPLTRFTATKPIDHHVYMDASDFGVCALYPMRHEYLQVQFTADERTEIEAFNRRGSSNYGINVREL